MIKNSANLKRIVKTSSDENSFVLDCFCGSGTTLKAAHLNSRHWIGIDQSDEAIKATINKLGDITGDLFLSQTDYQLWTEEKRNQQQLAKSGADVGKRTFVQ